jgi:flagellar L-ring protein FlgH
MSPTKRFTLVFGLIATFGLIACGPPHIAPFTPRQRVYQPGNYAQRDPSARPTNGSLYSDAVGGLLEDTRAVRVGDFVVININESADASGTSATNLSKDSSGSAGADALVGIIPALKKAYPNMDPTKLFDYASSGKFKGEGDTARNGQLTGHMAARVVRGMPNGDLFLEGTKVVLINNEEYHLYVSGLVRPTDIAQDNTIASTRIADAQIEFTGRGDIADQQRKGWGARLLDTLNPF